jgi:glutaredoxin-related protein
MFARHVKGLSLDHVELRTMKADLRPSIILDDVVGADFDHVKAAPAAGVPAVELKNVDGFVAHACAGLPETRRDQPVADERF